MNANPIVVEDLQRIAAADLPWEVLAGSHVLVTGAAGFLPAYMVETILHVNTITARQPATVTCLVRNADKAQKRFAAYSGRADLRFVVQDVCDPLAEIARADFIVHAASNASPKFYGADPVGTITANVIGTRNVLELARARSSAGVLFFSSGEVYGQVDDAHIPTRESDYGIVDPTDVRSCYAESKRLGETLCVSYAHQYGVPVKIVRPFHTYGPGMAMDDGRVFADFVANIVNRTNIVLRSDGSARRAFCYLADAVAGFFTVLLRGAAGQAYNIGNPGAEIGIAELASLLVGLYPERDLNIVQESQSAAGYIASKIVRNSPDISKANALGWKPWTTIADGFSRTIRSIEFGDHS
ncbi:MAG TPA: NAD-dependent epimerase/dehydratase family protein [Capsulimonadaceae bacterium]|jgi:nucleoside-diphosphate-sugar epimerase